MAEFVYVDNSNIFIEGKKIAAQRNGDGRELDFNFRLDFGELYDFVAENNPNKIARALLLGSSPPVSDKVWGVAERVGFEVVVIDRNAENREKKIDTGIVAAMVRDAYTRVDKTKDTITLVAGDSDYVPAVQMLTNDNFSVEVVFWSNASAELKAVASRFIELDRHFNDLEYDD
ncbi:MAG TPA: NYN domain-containing protein [Pyrinomonadaceae bacterium]|nr:NYN domain-containing protein [Pyrinomonadaceae bacterium]